MYDRERELWIELIETYKEMPLLWNPKDKNYTNKNLRNEANEKLLKFYKKIDSKGTLAHMKKKLDNMRTTYNRERKKQIQNTNNGDKYIPTLWYYDNFSFLEETVETLRNKEMYSYNFNRSDNKIYLEKNSPVKRGRVKRKRESTQSLNTPKRESPMRFVKIAPRIELPVEPSQSSGEEEEVRETSQPPPPKRRIFDLLEKQERFIDTAGRMLTKKEQEWEVLGKSIGLQLMGLEGRQRTIANKLISDAIFYGSMGKLTLDSFVNVENYEQRSPQSSMDHMDPKEEIMLPASGTVFLSRSDRPRISLHSKSRCATSLLAEPKILSISV